MLQLMWMLDVNVYVTADVHAYVDADVNATM